jgi:hypothetical protein
MQKEGLVVYFKILEELKKTSNTSIRKADHHARNPTHSLPNMKHECQLKYLVLHGARRT